MNKLHRPMNIDKRKNPGARGEFNLSDGFSRTANSASCRQRLPLFAVVAKCGHVGRDFYAEKTFAVQAENGRHAAAIARGIARVKHHHKDAILRVEKISRERYDEIKRQNCADPFFHCKCVQDQRRYDDPDIREESSVGSEERPCEDSKPNYFGKKRIRNFRKFVRTIDFRENRRRFSYKRTG